MRVGHAQPLGIPAHRQLVAKVQFDEMAQMRDALVAAAIVRRLVLGQQRAHQGFRHRQEQRVRPPPVLRHGKHFRAEKFDPCEDFHRRRREAAMGGGVEQRITRTAAPLRETAAEHQHITHRLRPEAEAVDAACGDDDVAGRLQSLGGIVDGERHLSLRYQHDLHAADVAVRGDFPVVQGTSRCNRLDMSQFREAFGHVLAVKDVARNGA